jgi:hypothetical protein
LKASEKIVATIAVIAILAVGTYFALPYLNPSSTKSGSTTTKGSSRKSGTFFVSLTDPPNVPAGTTALYVTYSQIQLVVSDNGSESTIGVAGSGTVNVLTLINSSTVIGTANLSNGTILKQIKFTISNATITIGGVNSSVVIGENVLTTNVSGTYSGKEAALVDLQPSITEIQTVDENVYVLTPAVKSVLAPVGQFGQIQGQLQQGMNLGNFNGTFFGGFLNSPASSLSITNSSLVVTGNDTSFSVTIKNNGNSSVQLMGLNLQGQKQLFFPQINVQVSPPPLGVGFMAPLPPDRAVIFPNGTKLYMSNYFVNNQYQPPVAFNFTSPLTTYINNSTGIYSLVPAGSTYAAFNQLPPPSTSVTTFVQPPPPPTPIPIPNGTMILFRYPQGFVPPSSTPPQAQISFMEQQPIGRFIYPNGTVGFPPMIVSVPSVQLSNSGSTPSSLNVSVSVQQSQMPSGYVLAPGQSVTLTLNGELAIGPAPMVNNPQNGQMVPTLPPFASLSVGQSYVLQIMTTTGPVQYNMTASAA